MFHIQLSQSVHVSREFNLSEEDLRRRIVEPWLARSLISSGDRDWAPERAKLTIYEGPELGPGELGIGRGWGNVTKQGTDVTARWLARQVAAPAPATGPSGPPPGELERCRQEIARCAREGELDLGDCLAIAGALHFGSRVSERVALVEQAVWELLHMNLITLEGEGIPDGAGTLEWQGVLLDWNAWTGARAVSVRPG